MGTVAVQAPRHLSKQTAKLYRRLVTDYRLDDEAHALEVLRLACEAIDRCDEAREAIAKDGPFIEDRFGQLRCHPGVQVERDSRLAALRALRELSLDGAAPDDVRPPRLN